MHGIELATGFTTLMKHIRKCFLSSGTSELASWKLTWWWCQRAADPPGSGTPEACSDRWCSPGPRWGWWSWTDPSEPAAVGWTMEKIKRTIPSSFVSFTVTSDYLFLPLSIYLEDTYVQSDIFSPMYWVAATVYIILLKDKVLYFPCYKKILRNIKTKGLVCQYFLTSDQSSLILTEDINV